MKVKSAVPYAGRNQRLPIQITNKIIKSCRTQILYSFLSRKSALYFFLIIEAKPPHSLDTRSKCEKKKLKQQVILMQRWVTLSLNNNTSELLGFHCTSALKLSARFCRDRIVCLVQSAPQNMYTATTATQTNSQNVDLKHAGPRRRNSCPQLWRAVDQTN